MRLSWLCFVLFNKKIKAKITVQYKYVMRCSRMLIQAFQWFTLRKADAFFPMLCQWTNERAKRVENQFEKVVFVFKPSLNNALTL